MRCKRAKDPAVFMHQLRWQLRSDIKQLQCSGPWQHTPGASCSSVPSVSRRNWLERGLFQFEAATGTYQVISLLSGCALGTGHQDSYSRPLRLREAPACGTAHVPRHGAGSCVINLRKRRLDPFRGPPISCSYRPATSLVARIACERAVREDRMANNLFRETWSAAE